jgi:hypothetical protein
MKYANVFVLLLITAGLCYLLGRYIATKFAQKQHKRRIVENTPSKFPLSAFSVLNHPAAAAEKEGFTPVREAEVYLAYGRRHEANEVLEQARKQGDMTAEEVASFWAERNLGKVAD